MPVTRRFTLCKEERICSKLLIDQLFNGGNSHSMVAFPLRAVYVIKDRNDNMLHASADIENKVCNLLQRIGEKIETDRKEAIQE